jgi:hypothetical protein
MLNVILFLTNSIQRRVLHRFVLMANKEPAHERIGGDYMDAPEDIKEKEGTSINLYLLRAQPHIEQIHLSCYPRIVRLTCRLSLKDP